MKAPKTSRYQEYAVFADNLEKQLVAAYGAEKAGRLYRRMSPSRFEAIWGTSSNDALKRQWIERLQERAAKQALGTGKDGEAA